MTGPRSHSPWQGDTGIRKQRSAKCQWSTVGGLSPTPVRLPLCHLPDLRGAGGAPPSTAPPHSRLARAPYTYPLSLGGWPAWGWEGGPPVSSQSRDPVLGLDHPAQLPAPRSAPTPSPRPVLTKAVQGCWPLRMGGDRGGSPTPDLGHTPTALSGRTSQVGAGGPGRPGSPVSREGRWRWDPNPLLL